MLQITLLPLSFSFKIIVVCLHIVTILMRCEYLTYGQTIYKITYKCV